MLKKPGILLSCSNLYSLQGAPASKTSSFGPAVSPSPTQRPPTTTQQCRYYAQVSDGHGRRHHHDHDRDHDHGKLRWPENSSSSANSPPTPYQIFDQRKGSQYSKKRFYELVKLYHPDRHDHDIASRGLSYATKLERYRLVVAANEILSDPVKRSAYDYYGAGWNGAPDVVRPRDTSSPATTWGGYSARGWTGGAEGPSQNATWEDWERWYQKDANGPQEPQYVSNSAFVGLIVVFALVGGIGQVTRAGSFGVSFVEQRDALHNNLYKDLIRRRRETTTAYGSREERIDSFLRQRDPIGYGLVDPKMESYRRALPPPEICSSGDIKQRSMDIYRQNGKPDGKDG